MIKKHRHHIIPRYSGGSNDRSNIVELTPIQHAMWHYAEWLRKGEENDRLAWRGLAGLISSSEAREQAIRLGSKLAKEARAKNNPKWHERMLLAAQSRQEWLRKNSIEWRQAESARMRALALEHGHKGGEATRGKSWWHNDATGQTTRAAQQPGPEWRKGKAALSAAAKKRQSKAQLGSVFWNNGRTNKRSKECPGAGWVRGRLPRIQNTPRRPVGKT